MTRNNKGRNGGDRATPNTADTYNHTAPNTEAPIVTGQCAQVLTLIRHHQPLLSFVLTADHAIPGAAARVHELRCMGFNILTRIVPEVEFRGSIRRNAALYSVGNPEWPQPGFEIGERGDE